MFKKASFAVVAALGALMCAETSAQRLTEGPKTPLGAGHVRSFVQTDAKGAPAILGVAFTKESLDNLPQNCATEKPPATSVWALCSGGKMNDALVTILDTPAPGARTNVKTMELSWLPFGHAPEHVWDKPQFDIHFNLAVAGEDAQRLYVKPDANALPEGYEILPGSGMPWNTPAQKYHSHAADPKASPEFGGGKFTTNFLYINYDGKVIGYEPYVTLEYLKAQTGLNTLPIKTPAAYPSTGYYPSAMRVGWDASMKAYVIAFEGFKQYTAQAKQ